MTVAVIVPVKDLSRAKSRLAGLMTESERSQLAQLMLQGVLEAVARIPPDEVGEPLRRIVVTGHAPSAELARTCGFEILAESRPISESDSVDRASAHLESGGVRGVLRVPLDLPLIETDDLLHLLKLIREGARTLLVPSLSETGTNALYRSPPTAFPSRFGSGSLALHQEEARRKGIAPRVVHLRSLALDIDEPEDLRVWVKRAKPSPAFAFLRQCGIEARLAASSSNSEKARDVG